MLRGFLALILIWLASGTAFAQFAPIKPQAPKPAPPPVVREQPKPQRPRPVVDAPPPAPRAPIQYDDERIAWDACNASKTLAACQAYVAKYPAGRWIENARAKIADFALEEKERAVWTQCQSGSTAAACETYLSAYPTGRWADLARSRMRTFAAGAQEKLDGDACTIGQTVSACERYLAAFPGGSSAAAARDIVGKFRAEGAEKAAWALCQNGSTAAPCQQYLSAFRAGPNAAAATEQIARIGRADQEKARGEADRLAKAEADQQRIDQERQRAEADRIAKAEADKVRLEQDRQRAEAERLRNEQERIRVDAEKAKLDQEKSAWAQCDTAKVPFACTEYLRVYPVGMFADSARTRIKVLETAETAPEMVPGLGLVIKRNDKGQIVVVSVERFSSAMGNVFIGDVILKVNDAAVVASNPPRQTLEAAMKQSGGRVKLLIQRGPAAVTAVLRAKP